MQHKKIALVLECLTGFLAFLLSLVAFWFMPLFGRNLALYEVPYLAWLFWPCLVFVWVVCGLGYAALFRFFTVCREIGRGNSFSQKNARAFRWIGHYAVAAGVLLFAMQVVLIVFELFGAPWLFLFFFLILFCVCIAVLAYCLSRLIANAADLKEQNDLTI